MWLVAEDILPLFSGRAERDVRFYGEFAKFENEGWKRLAT